MKELEKINKEGILELKQKEKIMFNNKIYRILFIRQENKKIKIKLAKNKNHKEETIYIWI